LIDIVASLLDLTHALRLRKAKALFLFLAVEQPKSHRTEKLQDMFWQEFDRDKASTSLRQVVRHIRVALPQAGTVSLESGSGLVALHVGGSVNIIDAMVGDLVDTLPDGEGSGRISAFLELVDLLQGISRSFDSWLEITRSRLLSELQRRLDECLIVPAKARRAAELALEIEPSHEPAVRFLMTLDWQRNRATRAIERYNALYAYLDREFDQEPEPETIALLAAIKQDPSGHAALATPESPVQLAIVLSLQPNPALGPEPASLACVLFADLRMRLGRFREWRVIDDHVRETPQVRIQLQVMQAGGFVHLFVEVKQGQNGHLLWTDTIDDPSRDWEAKSRILITGIANSLSIVVAERSLSDRSATIYDLWLRSQVLLDTWSPDSEGAALALLREITREAPRFGPAHAELAGALNVRHVLLPGTWQTEDIRQVALNHALEAVSIDPLDTRAHRVLAWCYCHKGEFGLAEFHFDQALSLNRSNPLTLASCALGFGFSHRLDRAAALVAEVRSHSAGREPFHLIYLAATDYLCGDYAAAERQCAEGAGLMTTVGGWHTAALWKLGRKDEAVQRLQAWLDEIVPQWRGAEPASTGAVLDWFAEIFPLRHEEARRDLRATLEEVAYRHMLVA
jgi:DNA-binding SARP family transcriptional activator